MINEKFGWLTVLENLGKYAFYNGGKHGNRSDVFKCECKCGKITYVQKYNLKSGKVKGCGCRRNIPNRNKPKGIQTTINHLYGRYKEKARLRNLKFDLDKVVFLKLIKQSCYYCGENPKNEFNPYIRKNGTIRKSAKNMKKTDLNKMNIKRNGIDRLDNNVGYFIDNCVPCCSTCNYMKRNLNLEDFFNKIQEIYLNHS